MRSPVRSVATSPIPWLAAGLWSQAPGIDVVTDPACFREAVGPVTRIDFEGLPRRGSSCPIDSKGDYAHRAGVGDAIALLRRADL